MYHQAKSGIDMYTVLPLFKHIDYFVCFVSLDPNDFTVSLLSEELVFTPDNYQTDICVTVALMDDSVYEEFEYFEVSLTTNEECIEFKEESISVSITDDDGEC